MILSCMPAFSAETGGLTFDANTRYVQSEHLTDVPLTFECVLSLPKSHSDRGGVIIGNYGGIKQCLNFEVYSNGNPRLYYVDEGGTVHNFVFTGVDVRTGGPVHRAIVSDASSKKVTCYLNGKAAGTLAGALPFSEKAVSCRMAVGGDCRSGNAQYFKGRLMSLALFDRVRSAEEIAADAAGGIPSDAFFCVELKEGAEQIPDLSGNGNGLVRSECWIGSVPDPADYAFSFCLVGDTQIVTLNSPDKLSCIYDWILDNIERRKIAFVFGLGDITDKDTAAEWDVAKREIFKLNGKVGYSLVRGNHDSSGVFNRTFGVDDYTDRLEGRYMKRLIDNSYQLFSAGGVDFLQLSLDYGASDAVLRWAAGIIEKYPDRQVIITTHCYLFRDGTTLDAGDVVPPNKTGDNSGNANNGDQMWDKLVKKYPNILLVLSGHDPCDDVILTQTAGENGNIVTQILSDPQGVDKAQGATGMVTMLYFSADGKTMTVRNYSTVRDKYYMGTSQMTVGMPGFAAAAADTGAELSGDTSADTPAESADTSAEDLVTDAVTGGPQSGGCRSAGGSCSESDIRRRCRCGIRGGKAEDREEKVISLSAR
ncbi:MAG: metallophosphoesterase [Clostridiales bacterium]|nr:metallophosphoesterase [Clostridiales bacterium]